MGGSMARKESRAPNGHPAELKKKKRPLCSNLLYCGLFCYGDPLICGNIPVFRKKPKRHAGEAMQPQKSASVKRKAPYFLRSTVLFWWRIAGSNR